MIGFDDNRWDGLAGGYRTAFDPRPLLIKLQSQDDTKNVWQQLWEELHHQGDVGEASYAAVPHLVQLYRQQPTLEWNTYAIVAVIELARGQGGNPDIPTWLRDDYFQAVQDLASVACVEVLNANDTETVRAMLSIIAIAKGARNHARFLLEYSDEELVEIESRADVSPD